MGNKQLLSRSRGSMTGFVFWGALVASAWGIVGVSPLTAQDDKAPKLLISNQKTGPGEKPKASFTLRPNLPNQPFYLFVQNPDTVDKKVVVEVRVNGAPVPGGRAEVQVGPGKTAPVAFGKTPPMPPPKDPAAKPTPAAPAANQGIELKGHPKDWKIEIQVAPEGEKEKVETYLVHIMTPAEYLKPDYEYRIAPGGQENALTVNLKPLEDFRSGPPCPVKLELSPNRIPGLVSKAAGKLQGLLAPSRERPLELFAKNLKFTETPETGQVTVTADGYDRAFILETSFGAAAGQTVRMDLDKTIGLDIPVKPYARPGKIMVPLEVDNAGNAVDVKVSLGRYEKDKDSDKETFVVDDVKTRHGPREQHVFLSVANPEGTLLFDTQVKDWVLEWDTTGFLGPYVLQAEMVNLAKDNDRIKIRGEDKVEKQVTFDDTPPEGIKFGDFPPRLERGAPLVVKATATDNESKISKVYFFVGNPENNKRPEKAPFVEAKPVDETWWAAELPVATDAKATMVVSVEFVNGVELSAFQTIKIELVDPGSKKETNPNKATNVSIKGVVVENGRPQAGTTVTLNEAAGKKETRGTTKTDKDGKFEFKEVPPGNYIVSVRKTFSKGETPVVVEKDKTKEVTVEVSR